MGHDQFRWWGVSAAADRPAPESAAAAGGVFSRRQESGAGRAFHSRDALSKDLRSGVGIRRRQRPRTTAEGSGLRHPGGQERTGGTAGRQEYAEPDGTGGRHERPIQEDHFLEGGDRRTAGKGV